MVFTVYLTFWAMKNYEKTAKINLVIIFQNYTKYSLTKLTQNCLMY